MSSYLFSLIADKFSVLKISDGFKILIIAMLSNVLIACGIDSGSDVVIETASIAPDSTSGRLNKYLGCIDTSAQSINYKVWAPEVIDGDIISLIVNGSAILSEYTLERTHSGGSFTLPNNGFNYLVYYAHNTGSAGASTAVLNLDGGADYILEANLETNGYFDIVVGGFGVSCADSIAGGSSGGSGGVCTTDDGEITISTTKITGGPTSVQIDGSSVGSLTDYYGSGSPPPCGSSVSGGSITRTLSAGSHTVYGEDDDQIWPLSSVTIEPCECLTYVFD